MDLFAIAQENMARLEEAFRRLSSGDPIPTPTLLAKFLDEVSSKGRVSVNMRPWITADLLQGGKYYNMYEVVDEDAAFSGRDSDELLRERLGKYYKKRTSFARLFEEGHKFRYGALNIGGAGTPSYGPFCVVLKQSFPETSERVAYVKQDSLNGYTDEDGNLDRVSFQKDLACHSHRQYLAALKHAHELEIRKDEWPKMLCSNADCVEAIFIAVVEVSKIEEVRVPAIEHKRLWDLCFNAHGRKLTDEERALGHFFRQILRAKRDRNIKLSEVPDD